MEHLKKPTEVLTHKTLYHVVPNVPVLTRTAFLQRKMYKLFTALQKCTCRIMAILPRSRLFWEVVRCKNRRYHLMGLVDIRVRQGQTLHVLFM